LIYHFPDCFHADIAEIVCLRVRQDINPAMRRQITGSAEDVPSVLADVGEFCVACFAAARHQGIDHHRLIVINHHDLMRRTNMEVAGISKIECPWFVVSIAQNPEAVTVDDEDAIPRDYFKEIPASFVLDKVLLKQAIKDGYTVPGARLTRGTSLRIK